jgi:hypothetical protein
MTPALPPQTVHFATACSSSHERPAPEDYLRQQAFDCQRPGAYRDPSDLA